MIEMTEELEVNKELDFSDLEDTEERECPFSMTERKKIIEGVLFVSDKPVGLSALVSAFGEEESANGAELKPIVLNREIEEALDEYKADLENENRAFRLVTANGGFQLRTSEELKPYLQNTIKARSFRLTGPSLETLAIVAYKQPVTKSQVDDVRGVESSHLMRALMDKDLLAFAGKSELPGKPMLYKTTPKFLEIFGLRNLNELPSLSEIEALLPDGIGNEEEEEDKETLSELAGKLSETFDGSYSVGEEELGKISDELSDISTSSEFFEQEKKREKEKREQEKADDIRERIMLDDDVSERDKKWLARFDEKQSQDDEEELTDNDNDGEEEEAAALMAESSDQNDEAEADEDDSLEEIELSSEDLHFVEDTDEDDDDDIKAKSEENLDDPSDDGSDLEALD